MELTRKTARLGLWTVAATGLLMASATPANATTLVDIGQGAGACPSNYVCLWSESDFIGDEGHKYGAIAANQNVDDMGKLRKSGALWKGMQDIASSVVNNTGSSICFYEHNGFVGREFRVRAYTQWPNVPSWINDQISSFKYC